MSLKTRDSEILKLLDESPSQFVSVESLAEYFKTSESTIRRDLQRMASQHQIMRVHGGAASLHFSGNFKFERLDKEYLERERTEPEVKKYIAKKAASFIKDGSCVYMDASTTVASMIPFLPSHKNVCYVTNSPLLAQKLVEKGITCYVTGGELKLTTNAFIGSYALEFLKRFNFDIGFFGTNGIHPQAKFPILRNVRLKQRLSISASPLTSLLTTPNSIVSPLLPSRISQDRLSSQKKSMRNTNPLSR